MQRAFANPWIHWLSVAMMFAAGSAQAQDVAAEGPADEAGSADSSEVGVDDEAPLSDAAIEPNAERIEEGRLLFLAAERAFDAGRYEDALDSFERSYALAEDPQILFNIAVTLDRLRRDEEALEAFRTFLRLQPDTPDRMSIEARIRVLEDSIARRNVPAVAETVPTPTATAVAPALDTREPGELEDDQYTVLNRWWFWTAIGLFVAGGVAAAIAIASQPPAPAGGSEGVVIEALSW